MSFCRFIQRLLIPKLLSHAWSACINNPENANKANPSFIYVLLVTGAQLRPISSSEKGKGLLASWNSATSKADIVVALDGSGNYKTINEAVAALSSMTRPERTIVYVKSGTYRENVEIGRGLDNLMFVGDGIDKTIVTGNKNVPDGATTLGSATFGKVLPILENKA